MNNLKKVKLGKCNNIYMHKNKKFKSIGVSIVYKMKYDYKYISIFKLLIKYLGNCNKEFPSIESFNKNIENLYGSNVGIKTDYIGSSYTVNFYINFVEPKYVNDENLCEKAIKILHDMIYNPLIVNGTFNEQIFNICKENCLLDTESLNEYNMAFVLRELKTSLVDNNTKAFCSSILGDKKVLEKINSKNIVKYYNLLLHSPFDIYITGDYKFTQMEKIIRKYFNKKHIRNISYDVFEPIIKNNFEPIIINKNVSQTKLAIAYKIPILFNNDKHYAFRVARLILSGTLSSKFYRVIREKLGLCYSINSTYYSFYGAFIVTTGINKENIDLVIKEVNNQIDEVKKSNITDEEFIQAKETIINDLLSVNDSLFATLDMIKTYHSFQKDFILEEELKRYENVSKEDVVEAINQLVYCNYCVLK